MERSLQPPQTGFYHTDAYFKFSGVNEERNMLNEEGISLRRISIRTVGGPKHGLRYAK